MIPPKIESPKGLRKIWGLVYRRITSPTKQFLPLLRTWKPAPEMIGTRRTFACRHVGVSIKWGYPKMDGV